MIFLKSKRELKRLKASCQLTARILQEMGGMVRTGVTSLEINDYGGRRCHDEGVRPVFLNYPGSNGQPPFPGVMCASPNSVVVHGIPDDVPLVEGDILSVDFGIKRDSYCGDTAYTFKVGQVSESTQHLLDVCEEALRLGIEQAVVGNRVGDISYAVQTCVESHGYGIVRPLVGHGIGRNMHEDPQVPNYGDAGKGDKLRKGMTIAIEPMITQGHHDVDTLDDKWSVATKDGKLAAHFEHVVAILSDGPEIFTMTGQ